MGEFAIPVKTFSNDLNFRHTHDTLLFYKKSNNNVYNRIFKTREEDIVRLFPHQDEKGLYTFLSLFGKNDLPSLKYEWKGIEPPDGYSWRFSLEKLVELDREGLITFHEKDNKVYQKRYLVSEDQLMPVGTIWDDIFPVIKNKSTGEQSILLIERILKMGSNEGALILDPFCGSGVTGVASNNLNRDYILCDSHEEAIKVSIERLSNRGSFKLLTKEALVSHSVIWNKYEKLKPTIEDEILNTILYGESDKVEFKESALWNFNTNQRDDKNSEKVIRSIASFLNSFAGGQLFLGVRNNKEVMDLTPDFEITNQQKKDKDGYELWLRDKITMLLGSHTIGVNRQHKVD